MLLLAPLGPSITNNIPSLLVKKNGKMMLGNCAVGELFLNLMLSLLLRGLQLIFLWGSACALMA